MSKEAAVARVEHKTVEAERGGGAPRLEQRSDRRRHLRLLSTQGLGGFGFGLKLGLGLGLVRVRLGFGLGVGFRFG